MPLHFSTPATEAPAPARERETLFTIDGRDCTIPVRFAPLECARYAHTIQEFGPDAGAVFALRMALGESDYLAFLNLRSDTVTDEDWTRIVGVITGRLVGLDVEVPKDPAPEHASAAPPATPAPAPDPERPAWDPSWPAPESLVADTAGTPQD